MTVRSDLTRVRYRGYQKMLKENSVLPVYTGHMALLCRDLQSLSVDAIHQAQSNIHLRPIAVLPIVGHPVIVVRHPG